MSNRSRCGAVPILERFRRRGEGGGGEGGEEGGLREEEGGSREEGGGGRREEGGGRRAGCGERRPGTRWKRPLPSATDGLLGKYLASSGAKLLLLK